MLHREVLIAEDEETDVFFLRRGLEKAGIPNPVRVARNGEAAIEFLSSKESSRPCLLITDLKMPGLDGFSLIEWVKKQPEYKGMPVVVITSSDFDVDRERCIKLGADEYFVKPNDYVQWANLGGKLRERWLA